MFKNGDIVRAEDKGNYGTVIGVDKVKNTVTVKFTNPDSGNTAEVEFPTEQLELIKSYDPKNKIENDPNSVELLSALNNGDTSVLDTVTVTLGGDKFIPAFAGYIKNGYNKNATSIMRCSAEERIKENPDLGILDDKGFSFEPIITERLEFMNVAKRTSESLNLPAGVIPIFGTTGSGKSTLAYFLAKTLKAEFIRFGEPEIPSIHDPKDVMAGIHDFLNNDDSKFLVVDSFRPFMFLDTEKASMGKGGVNNALYMDFTALSSLASWAGKTIFIVINPLAFNKDDVETVRSNLESSTVGLLHTTEYGQFTFVSRTKSNNRVPTLYSTDYDSQFVELKEKEDDVISTNDLVISKLNYKSGVWNRVLNKLS